MLRISLGYLRDIPAVYIQWMSYSGYQPDIHKIHLVVILRITTVYILSGSRLCTFDTARMPL